MRFFLVLLKCMQNVFFREKFEELVSNIGEISRDCLKVTRLMLWGKNPVNLCVS